MKPASDLEDLHDAPTISASRSHRAGSDRPRPLHPAWFSFIRHCHELRHGEIERLVIQDGLPVLAEVTRRKVKFA